MELNPQEPSRGEVYDDDATSHGVDPGSLAMSDLFSALFLLLIALLIVALIQLQEAKREHQALAAHIREKVISYQVVIKKLTKIKEALKREKIPVEINPRTGEVVIKDDGVMFNIKSAQLSREARRFLKRFSRVYFNVVLDESFSEQISWVVVEGHASLEGERLFNLELSTQRAHAVAEFLLKSLEAEAFKGERLSAAEREVALQSCERPACLKLKRLQDRLLTAGRGEFSAHSTEDARDRSVRFRLHFKGDLFDLYENKDTQRLILAPHERGGKR